MFQPPYKDNELMIVILLIRS